MCRLGRYSAAALLAACLFAPAAQAAAAPLRYWFWWEPSSFDTYRADSFDVMQVARNIYAPLVSIGMDGKPQGMAADDWEVNPSGLVWRFHIRKGLTFEDGSPVTAAVVLVNFRRLLWLTRGESLPLNSLMPETETWRDYSAPLSCLYAEDETLVFRFKKRPDNLFEILSHPVYGVASPACFDSRGLWKEPFCSVASGQYRVEERRPGLVRLVSRRVFPAAAGSPERVEVRTPLKDGESSLKMLFSGEGELAIEPGFALSSATLGAIAERGFRLTEEPPSRMYFIQLNHRRPPFNDRALRESVRDMFLALFHAACRERGIPPQEPSFMPRGGVGYGLFKAPANPAPAVRSSVETEVVFFPLASYFLPEDRTVQETAEAAFLKTLELHGLRVKVSRHTARKGAIQRFTSGDFGAIMRGSGITINDPYAGLKMMFLSSISARIPDPSGKASAHILAANESGDPVVRRQSVEKMNRVIYEDAAVITFAHSSWIYVHKPGVDMSRFNLFMDPLEFRAVGWKP